MARLSCIALIVGLALVCVLAKEEFYSDRFDDVDIPAIFNNNKLRRQYYSCLMDTGPCATAPQRFIKDIFGEIIQTQCKKCTEKQKGMFEYIIEWYTEHEPVEWQALVTKLLADLQKKA
ncbi:ObirCSP10.2 [Ooceraea biroi]|uniref:ObirCsp10 n=1 Tax=Ooceraea biroi TaxID=2015173 RepID=A0A026VZ15_OOCBI|nr:putative odorant-binding protein A10 [Ooceraea biroi]XP_026830449.1 putative odorant-binding protein A10 [Ooceraea biroi]EZA48691.1 hypothetical protein X777_13205 [Ooceraea biroi]RLU15341.1 ObirCsp10 [Ooceraea biroi]RLU15452.1 ObirCSP10.2 [Ooceraea biroi]